MKGRILGIDYGKARVGIATTDPLQIIVTGKETLPASKLKDFITEYCTQENVVKVVIGKPTHKDGNPTAIWQDILKLSSYIKDTFPQIELDYMDESFTSIEAKNVLLQSAKKKQRRIKENVDKVSAILILQKYLGHI